MAEQPSLTQYEDDEAGRRRALSNGQVLAFIGGYWRRRPWLMAATLALTLAAIVAELWVPHASQTLVNVAVAGPRHATAAWIACAVFVGVYFASSVLRNTAMRFFIPLATRTMQEMTDEGFRRVQTFSSDWHGATFAGATVRRLSRAMWGYDVVADSVVVWIGPALLVLFGLSVQMILRWPLVGVFSLVMVAAYIASTVALSNLYVRKAQRRSIAFDSRIGGALADAIASNPTVKGFGAEDREEARIHLVTDDWRVAANRTWNRYTDIWLVQSVMLGVLQAGLAGLMILRWTRGQASAGDVAFVITSFLVMSGYLRNMGENIRMMQRGLADIEDVAGYARTPPQVADAPDAVAIVAQDGAIVFDHVDFSYGEGKAAIYRDFSLTIRPGERVALVGPTGSGKSTFVKLIQRLYDLGGGRILIDGQDIATVTQRSLRRAIAVVPQDPALFHRTIAENIAYSRPGATTDEIVLAARRAHAHAFIEALPKGYETLVGERGVKLSGGERQRVAIARALLADAPILVLDEATSSLDVETEAEVQAATEAVMAGRTTILIAHRLSTIRSADRILVFEHGRVIEEGRHVELVAKGGAYARLNAVAAGV
jgi:ATP-binding cassette subfamily B protein